MPRPVGGLRGRVVAVLTTATGFLFVSTVGWAVAQGPGAPGRDVSPQVKKGLSIHEPRACRGYTLLNPMGTTKTYLLDMEGRVVRRWDSEMKSMQAAYLLENGHVLRVGQAAEGADKAFGAGPGASGRIQEVTWEGEVVWDFTFHNERYFPHHDAAKLPNGNYLMITWEKKSAEEAIAAGRKKELVSDYLLPDALLEIKPTGKTSGEVVWEWHLWDHLIQDHDSGKANYGDVAAHPELVDINYVESVQPTNQANANKDEVEKLKTIGYVASPAAARARVNPDWNHINAVDYNAARDEIMLSVHDFSEIWVIDHSTTTEEAAGHTGGRSGKGGDLLYRWGNPQVYRAGTKADQRLFAQHNAHWIPEGLPGAGHVLIFNNGSKRPDGDYSSVDEIVLPLDGARRYVRAENGRFGPEEAIWSYSAPRKSDFYSFFISGAHRLPNGNTLICSGANGTVFEVTPDKEIVWKYVNPTKGGFGPGMGRGGDFAPNQILNAFARGPLKLEREQEQKVDALQKKVDLALDEALTAEQKQQLRGRGRGPDFGAFAPPGEFLSTAMRIRLKLTPEQKARLDALQKEVDEGLKGVFTEAQAKQFAEMKQQFAAGPPGFGGPGPNVPPGAGGGPPVGGPPGGGPPGAPPAMLFAGPPGGNALFRAYRYAPDYPGLAARELTPGKTVEELEEAAEKAKEATK